ncbi:hypothetical protein ACJIZ3_017710 [Penstemon smallii]|uniref:Protein XRI1 n=1 Tax=Penstemon smallii TaxID=265156 RepID=A0ABD3SWS3_9LAMI
MENNDNDSKTWPWKGREYSLEDNTSLDISSCIWNNETQNEQDLLCILNDETTPLKDSGDLAFIVSNKNEMNKELEESRVTSSQGKSRRVLQFDSNISGFSHDNEEMPTFRKLNDMVTSIEEHLSEISEWMPQNEDCTSVSCLETLDQSEEGWIESCFNDADLQISPDDKNTSAVSDVQIDIAELQNSEIKHGTGVVQKHQFRPCVAPKGKKAYMQTPTSFSSYVVYPFDFLKPCGVKGDVTLKDINQKIHTPPSETMKTNEDLALYPTSAFSGKPVVGKTKIHTDGGRGSITIMRTKG